MGLFDKKYCDICGEKIGLLGNRKLEDGNLCKECAAKLSPWFSDRRQSTVAEIQEQLAYREANQARVSSFRTTRTLGERTKVLLHIVDVAGVDGRDPIEDFDKINNELAEYSERLARRKQLVVANKMDLPDAQENFERLKEYVEAKGYEIFKASAATGEGLRELMFKAYDLLLQYEPEEDEEDLARFDEIDPDSYEIVEGNDTDWEVRGKNIERLVAMTNFDNDEALYRFQLIWKRLGIDEALKEKGVQEGESVRIRDMVFEYKDNN